MSPTDEVSLAAGLSGVQSTLIEHGKRFDRVEVSLDRMNTSVDGKLDAVIARIDVLYPELATIKTQLAEHERRITEMSHSIIGLIGGVAAAILALVGNAVWAGYIRFGR
jgi:hypothetical protein